MSLCFLSSLYAILSHCFFLFSVLTPYYNEEVLYSANELDKENEDGISILFYLKKIYPGEFLIYCSTVMFHLIYA